jgi:hypothetical protein
VALVSRHGYGLLAFLTARVFASAPVDPRLTRPAPPAPRTGVKKQNRGPYSRAREEARRRGQMARLAEKGRA